MAKRKPNLSAVVALMSDNAQARLEESQPQEPVSQLPLETILPDFGQPRRLLPGDLADAIKLGTLSVSEAMQQWLERAEQIEAGASLRRGIQAERDGGDDGQRRTYGNRQRTRKCDQARA